MRRLGITQRVDIIADYGERRDALDQQWYMLAEELGFLPLPLPNLNPGQVAPLLEALELEAVLFSGGNSLACLEPAAPDSAPERDRFEIALLKEVIDRALPVVGVCRGMQLINVALGGSLSQIDGHVAVRHPLNSLAAVPLAEQVNSYHNWTIPADGLAEGLSPLAVDHAGNIEAFESIKGSILAMMWHPERESPISPLDINLIKRYLI